MGNVQAPEVDFEELGKTVAEKLSALPSQFSEAESTVKSAWEAAKAKSESYNIMGGKGNKKVIETLTPAATEKDIKIAAMYLVGKGEFAEKLASELWSSLIEPKVEEKKPTEQLSKIPNLGCISPDSVWNKVKGKVQGKVEDFVKKQIMVAVDEAVKKVKSA